MSNYLKYIILITFLFAQFSCQNEKKQAEKILTHYIDQKSELIRNFFMESAVATWNATVSGSAKDYQKLLNIDFDFNKSNQDISKLFAPDRFTSITQNVFTNAQDFELLQKLKFSGLITDSILSRQLNVLYQAFMGSQIDQEKYKTLTMKELKLTQIFTGFKLELNGKMLGSVQLDSLRKNSLDTIILRKISEGRQELGQKLSSEIIQMVKNRNEIAVKFGYPDYYYLLLETRDQTPEKIKILLDQIEQKTRKQFFEAKKVIDKLLAKKYAIRANKIQPWLYCDERSSYLPKKFSAVLDSLYSGIDPIQETAKFFEGIGLPIQNVIDNSDLSYRKEKENLTAMINVDFRNDIRLIAGIRNSYDGMFRMMHLGGHASHYNTISNNIPYLLRTPVSVIYEGIARYFENMASDYNWIKTQVPVDEKTQKEVILVCQHLHEVDRLFRCRKLMAFSEFEREIYRNPDQDLDLLWQQLNLKYLGQNYPAKKGSGFWAANKFATSLSCYSHNFVLADIFAAQLQHSVQTRVLKKTNGIIRNNKEVGAYLVNNLYRYGNLLTWEKLIEKATGEPLNPSYLVNELVGEDSEENTNKTETKNQLQ